MKKSYRVKSEKDFQTVFNKGNSVASCAFVVHKLIHPGNKHSWVGMSIGKKVGHTAVAKNRLRRYIRATLTEVKDEVDVKINFLVITRPYAHKFTMAEVKKNLIHAMTLAKLISRDSEENEEI